VLAVRIATSKDVQASTGRANDCAKCDQEIQIMKRLAIAASCLCAATAAFAQDSTNPAKSAAEAAAVQVMLQAQTPDDQIKAAEELITKYSSTNYKAYALVTAAGAYEQKGDHARAIADCERALTADPKDFDAEILMGNVIASNITDIDPDKAAKLARAEKAAKEALDMIKTAPKSRLFQMTDKQWTSMKNSSASQAWQVLAMAATIEKKPDEAVADYDKGLALTPDPALMVRVGRALESFQKYDDAIGWFDKAIASPDADAQLKDVAARDKARVAAEKARL
jgi:tetratricopeptide (TPR) repeat protein